MPLPRTQIFKPSDWLDMDDCAYEFGTLAQISGHDPWLGTYRSEAPYLLDIIDNIKRIDEGRDNASV